MAGAPIGNKNASKGKIWNDALRRAIASDQGARVIKAANKLIDEAAAGAPWAIKELADRLDGRSNQIETEEIQNASSGQKTIQIVFVKPKQRHELSVYESTS